MAYSREDAAKLAHDLIIAIPGSRITIGADDSVAVQLGDKTAPAAHRSATIPNLLLPDGPPTEVPELFRSVDKVKQSFGI